MKKMKKYVGAVAVVVGVTSLLNACSSNSKPSDSKQSKKNVMTDPVVNTKVVSPYLSSYLPSEYDVVAYQAQLDALQSLLEIEEGSDSEPSASIVSEADKVGVMLRYSKALKKLEDSTGIRFLDTEDYSMEHVEGVFDKIFFIGHSANVPVKTVILALDIFKAKLTSMQKKYPAAFLPGTLAIYLKKATELLAMLQKANIDQTFYEFYLPLGRDEQAENEKAKKHYSEKARQEQEKQDKEQAEKFGDANVGKDKAIDKTNASVKAICKELNLDIETATHTQIRKAAKKHFLTVHPDKAPAGQEAAFTANFIYFRTVFDAYLAWYNSAN